MARLLAYLLSALTLLASESAHAESVRGISLPTRGAIAGVLATRAQRTAELLAQRLHKFSAPAIAKIDVSQSLRVADAFADRGDFDRAATAFDAPLATGARTPHRLLDAPRFVTATITRASIALARGESKKAQSLLARVLRYDPTAALLPEEDRPQLRAAFEAAKKESAFNVDTLGDACREDAQTLVLVRALQTSKLEFTRFDDCRLVAQVVIPQSAGDEEVLLVLSGIVPVAAAPELTPPKAQLANAPSWVRRHRASLGLGGAAVGSFLITLGTGLGADSAFDGAGCVKATLACENLNGLHSAQRLAITSDVFLGVSLVALASGVVLFALESKKPRAFARAGSF